MKEREEEEQHGLLSESDEYSETEFNTKVIEYIIFALVQT